MFNFSRQEIEYYSPAQDKEKEMKTYSVSIPIAGHAYVTVEAESEQDAIEKGMDLASNENIEWECLARFNNGNVCYCPSPWEAEAQEE